MRVLLAVVLVSLMCVSWALANGATVTPPVEEEEEIEVITPEPVTPPTPPGAGPAAITTPVTTIPVSVPVIVHKNVLAKILCEPNVTVLVPATVDPTTASRILANNQVAVVMAPIQLPISVSPALADRVISGAGPCPINVDPAGVSSIVNSSNLAMLALVNPIQFDQNMLNMMTSGQPIMMQQSSFSRLATAGQPIQAVPVTAVIPPPTGTMAGRGPMMSAPLTTAEASRALSGCAVMVAMSVDRQTLKSLVSSNTVQVVVPVTLPVPASAATTGITGTTVR